MKKDDIFERGFDGNVYRFKLTELGRHVVSIEVQDGTLPVRERVISSRLSPVFNNYHYAAPENSKYATTKEGDDAVEKLAVEMHKRILNWCNTLQWVDSNTILNKDEAKYMVAKLFAGLSPRFHDRYLPVVVRWTCYGEIDPDDRNDIKRMRKVISSFHLHLTRRNKDNIARFGYKVEFDDNGFKRRNVDGTVIRLERMVETEDALRPWLYL